MDHGFDNVTSSAWFPQILGNGTVNVHDSTRSHSLSDSARLTAIDKTSCSSTACKDTARGSARQNLALGPPYLDKLASANDSFSAWFFVAPSQLPAYSIHIEIQFSDSSIIEYWYGRSDLQNSTSPNIVAYNLTGIPAVGSWFQLKRNLAVDIQNVVANPSSTSVTAVIIGAYAGWFKDCLTCPTTSHGETVWLDDVAINFDIPIGTPVAIFDTVPARGTAPLSVQFNASASHEPSGFAASIIVFMWDFGDGTPAENVSDPIIIHTFNSTGTYRVTLTVIDSDNIRSIPSTVSIKVDPADITLELVLVAVVGGAVGAWALLAYGRRRENRRKNRKS